MPVNHQMEVMVILFVIMFFRIPKSLVDIVKFVKVFWMFTDPNIPTMFLNRVGVSINVMGVALFLNIGQNGRDTNAKTRQNATWKSTLHPFLKSHLVIVKHLEKSKGK